MDASVWSLVLASAENFVLINFALSLAALGGAALVRINANRFESHPLSLMRFFGATLVLPPVASAWLVISSLLPSIWLGPSRWAQEHSAPHEFHLLNAFTFRYDPFVGYGALIFVLAAASIAIWTAARAYGRFDKVVACLQIDAEPAAPERIKQVQDACQRYGIETGLVVSRYPFSFVWGHLRSKLIISTGLLNALTAEELSALLEHEAAHYARRDNLLKWFLSICRYTSPAFPLTGLLYRWWSEQVELVCDEVAARKTKAPMDVAGALVRLRRLTRVPQRSRSEYAESGFFGESSSITERRITRLLSLADERELKTESILSRSWFRAAILAGVLFSLTLLTLSVVSPLAIHRLVEALLHP